MAEFLLELLSEEIPARMQARAADDLKRLVLEGLGEAGLSHDRADAFATPRRLALVVDGLPLHQPDRREERKGPKVGAPDNAMEGFLRSTGLTLDQCEERETPKGPVWFAILEQPGRATEEVLSDIVTDLVSSFRWPMSMRWAENSTRWVRPLQGILALFGGKVVQGSVSLGKDQLDFSNSTVGHRFLFGDPVQVSSFADYRDKLRGAHVMLDPAERQDLIRSKAEELASKAGFSLRADEGLVAENAGLTEWPTPMIGTIDDLFMDVPAEVLITSMKTHQRYFAVERPDGSLAPHFVLTSNMVTDDGGAVIVAGNERVLRARLADAKFFWDQDRKTRLADRADTLANITFHAELGTMAEKAARLEGLAGTLCGFLDCSETDARRAARLAKCDLVSGMVGEFPELQGTIGAYYARSDGEPAPVADAIADHYAPQGPADRCPTLGTSVAVALADKLDTLAGFFAIDEKPTGSRDPFALRRAALGVIRLIVENGVRLPLRSLFARSVSLYQLGGDADAVADDLMVFIADRLKVALREKGVRHDLVDSVFALSGEDDLVRLLARVDALSEFLEGEDGTNLLTAYRRAANISRIEANKGDDTIPETVSGDLLRQDEERGLADMLDGLAPRLTSALEGEDFVGAMGVIANLRQPMDAFFDNVTVNADEPELRRNRLALLQQITTTMNQIADFSRVAS